MFFHGARIQRNGQGRCEPFPASTLSQAPAQSLCAGGSFASTDRHLTLLTLSVRIQIHPPDSATCLPDEQWSIRAWHKRTRATPARVCDLCQEYIGESSQGYWRW